MTSLFKLVLDEERTLRPAFILERGFSARVFPDHIDRNEFFSFAARDQNETAESVAIHHAEYGAEEETLIRNDVSSAWKAVFELSHEDIVVEFAGRNLFLWLPAGEHMYVAFGSSAIIEALGDLNDLNREFDEYVEESGLTEQGKAFLRDCSRKYCL
ncbi:hypothetical protein [Paracoccus methylarcula]|uniref:SMI1/KNR4 family protein n=1 Tax=Paracoccus methylarcula TaxID=72022 RepID=A0A3R7LIZ1_9RHOB|nr:hypothetical protein [Paracoccus methylarcula]RNF33564.1 hypothetical protein A7A09_015740 [Paracoccus methylarcula]